MPNIFTVNAHNNSSINWAQKSLQKQTIKPNLKFYCDTGYRNHGTLEGDHFLHRPLLFNAHARGPAPGADMKVYGRSTLQVASYPGHFLQGRKKWPGTICLRMHPKIWVIQVRLYTCKGLYTMAGLCVLMSFPKSWSHS